MLKACLNGARRPVQHPALPVTAAELARDAVRAAVPMPVGVTTGAWTLPDPAARVAALLELLRGSAERRPVDQLTGQLVGCAGEHRHGPGDELGGHPRRRPRDRDRHPGAG